MAPLSALLLVAWAMLASAAAQAPGSPLIAVMAVPREIAPIESRLEGARVEQVHGVTFTSGTIGGARVVAVRAGVGKVNSAMAATLLVERFMPAAVLFSGTAGAIDPDLHPGDVVIGTAVGHHDFGAFTAAAFVRGPTRNPATGLSDPAYFAADPRLLAAARRAAPSVTPAALPGLEARAPVTSEGQIVTGDAFVANPALRLDLRRSLNAAAVEMEGAAVAQICARAGVPLLVIRSITDRADGEASGSYQQYVEGASRNAAALALATIREYLRQPP